MKRVSFFFALMLCAVFAVPVKAQTAPDVYETQIAFPASYAIGDYVEFLQVVPMAAYASGYYEISISYTRGGIASAATHMAAVSHFNPNIWREAGRVNNNSYASNGGVSFTVDVNGQYSNARFRVRAINTYGVATDPIVVLIKVRSVNRLYSYIAANVTGNTAAPTALQPMTTEWTLLTGNPYNAASAVTAIHAKENGDVGIGTKTPQSKLSVAGTITAQKVKITATGWPDYVFENDYALPQLDSVANFIKLNKHLPAVPSAAEVVKDGHDLGDMNKILLQKVEELTLYLLNERTERKKLEAEVQALKAKIQ